MARHRDFSTGFNIPGFRETTHCLANRARQELGINVANQDETRRRLVIFTPWNFGSIKPRFTDVGFIFQVGGDAAKGLGVAVSAFHV